MPTVIEHKELPKFVGYCFGSDGTVWSRKKRGRIGGLTNAWKQLVPVEGEYGYLQVSIGPKCYYIHNLVLEAFRGTRPEGMQ